MEKNHKNMSEASLSSCHTRKGLELEGRKAHVLFKNLLPI